MLGEGAVMAVFLTLEPLTGPMKTAAKGVGTNHHDLMHHNYDRKPIVTMEEIIGQGAGLDIPLSLEIVKKTWAIAAQDIPTAMFAD